MSNNKLVSIELDLTETALLRELFSTAIAELAITAKKKKDYCNLYVNIINQCNTQQNKGLNG